MNRKEFIRNSLKFGLCSGSMLLFAPSAPAADEAPGQKFAQDWVVALMNTLDTQLPEAARIKVMESCGRACARRGPIKMAESFKGNLDGMLAAMSEHLGKENVRREGNTIHFGYSKCFCSLVAAGPARLSDTYCNCSRGWVLEMFETVTGKPVTVELKESIKRGGTACRFVIKI